MPFIVIYSRTGAVNQTEGRSRGVPATLRQEHYGRRGAVGAVRLDHWHERGRYSTLEAFVGRRTADGGVSGRNEWFTVYVEGRRCRLCQRFRYPSGGDRMADADQEHDKPVFSPFADPALLRKLEQMEQRIRALESQLRQKDVRDVARARGQAPASAAPPADAKRAKDQKDSEKSAARQSEEQNRAADAAKPDWAVLANRDITGKTGPTNPPNSIIGLPASPVTGLSMGAYGEMLFGAMQHSAARGQWQTGDAGPLSRWGPPPPWGAWPLASPQAKQKGNYQVDANHRQHVQEEKSYFGNVRKIDGNNR
jgi:hypothetical protein